MCGIGVIVSGVEISCTSQLGASLKVPDAATPCLLDLIDALRRRGPDSCGVRTVYVGATEKIKQSGGSCTVGKLRNAVEQCVEFDNQSSDPGELICCISNSGKKFSVCCSELSSGNPVCKSLNSNDTSKLRPTDVASPNLAASLQFVGTTLQLRGKHAVSQPLRDTNGNILIYNGEVFGGWEVGPEENDTQVVLSALQGCCCRLSESDSSKGQSIPEVLSQIRGPWALIYWQAAAQTLWFGRDAFGRRSLLVHWPSDDDPRFLLSSVSPADGVPGEAYNPFSFWEELACGIYSIHIEDGCLESTSSAFKGVTRIHDWQDSLLKKLISWERSSDESEVASGNANCNPREDAVGSPTMALRALKQAVKRRLVNSRVNQSRCIEAGGVHQQTPIAVLFSGGIDSMILAALADRCLDPSYAIDLLNVSFEGSSAPDRISAVAGLSELQRISPTRSWRLVEIDEELGVHGSHILFLICPSQTYMDSNIGTALWAAASGDGSVNNGLNDGVTTQRYYKYRSEARVVLVGAGADEQCGGYLRYRTKFKLGGWEALAAEMRLDMQRLWKRNLGRDDRCIADHGKEARFPFLDENVIETFLGIPLHEVADLREDIGIGDKKILRQVARLLGLSQSAALPKRAIQFGTGIARQSNRKNFGSNRAANKLSAGSVQVRKNIEVSPSQPSDGPNPAVADLCTITETEI